jgi:hypothetical protein
VERRTVQSRQSARQRAAAASASVVSAQVMVAHPCAQFGTTTFQGMEIEAVHCADLMSDGAQLWGRDEVFCAYVSSGDATACDSVTESVETASIDTFGHVEIEPVVDGECGVAGHSACLAQRNLDDSFESEFENNFSAIAGNANDPAR